jgi:hypothetical protein
MKALWWFEVGVQLHNTSFDLTIKTIYVTGKVVTVHFTKAPESETDNSSQPKTKPRINGAQNPFLMA